MNFYQFTTNFRRRTLCIVVLSYSLLGGCTRCHHTYHYELSRDTSMTETITVHYTSPEQPKGKIVLQQGVPYFHFYQYDVQGNRQATETQGNTSAVRINQVYRNDSLVYDSETSGGRARPMVWNVISDYSGDVIHRLIIGYSTHQFFLKNNSFSNVLVTYSTPTFRDSTIIVERATTAMLYTAQQKDSIFGAAVQPLEGPDRTSYIRRLTITRDNGQTIVDRLPLAHEWLNNYLESNRLPLFGRRQHYTFIVN